MKQNKLNRREFAEKTLAYGTTLGATSFVPTDVRGANDTVVIGAMGIGRRGGVLLSSFLRQKDVSVAAVCDIDERHLAEGIARTDGKAKGYHDFRNMLGQEDIDAILIGTPDHWHALPTVQACRADKDVYVEKPLCHNVREGQVILETMQETGRIVQMGTQQRSQSHWQQAVEIVKSGQLGTIAEIRVWNNFRYRNLGNPPDGTPPKEADYDFWLGPAPKRPFNPNRFHATALYFWDYAGGCVTSWGVHLLDVAYWALDLDGPTSVAAAGGKFCIDDNRETPDTFSAVYEYPGLTMTYMLRHWNGLTRPLGRFGKSNHGIEFHGTDASLYIDRRGFELCPVGDQPQAQSVEGGNGTEAHIRNFIDCVKSRNKPNSSADFGHPPSVATFLGNISYRTGRKIHWDPDTETIIGDAQASDYLSREYRKPWTLT